MLCDGSNRSGVRHFAEPMNLNDIRQHAWLLSSQALGREKISDITVQEVPADDPAVVALIMRGERNKRTPIVSDGTHPYVKQQQRKPPR